MKNPRLLFAAVAAAVAAVKAKIELLRSKTEQQDGYVVINGLKWDRSNTIADGETHFTQKQAIALAAKNGKRLPTKKEFKALVALGSTWDDDRNGRWFGEDHALKSDSQKSIFFPAAGCRTTHGASSNVSSNGYYWSGTVRSTRTGYNLSFYSSNVLPRTSYNYAFGFSVRCVRQ